MYTISAQAGRRDVHEVEVAGNTDVYAMCMRSLSAHMHEHVRSYYSIDRTVSLSSYALPYTLEYPNYTPSVASGDQ